MRQRLTLAVLLALQASVLPGCRDEAEAPKGVEPTVTGASSSVDHDTARNELQSMSHGASALVFEEYDHDFGRILDTQKVSTVFKFKNTSDETISLGKPQASCGCTVPKLEKSEYAPGESGSIDVTFSPKGSGKTTKNITIPIEGGGEPIRLSVSANIVPVLAVEPRGVSFINVQRGVEASVPVVIKSRDPNVKILSAEAKRCDVRIEVQDPGSKVDDADLPGQASLMITLPSDTPVGVVAGAVEVKLMAAASEGEEQKEQTIQLNVSGTVKGDLFAQPARFTVPSVASGKEFDSAVLVRSQTDKEFKVTGVEIQDANFEGLTAEYDLYEFAGLRSYRVTLKGVMPEAIGKMLTGRLVITTDVPGEETISLMINGRVPPKGGSTPVGTRPNPTPAPTQPEPEPDHPDDGEEPPSR